jgi:hypothetical protein
MIKKENEISALQIKIKEIADSRGLLTQGINKMETQLKAFREHRFN